MKMLEPAPLPNRTEMLINSGSFLSRRLGLVNLSATITTPNWQPCAERYRNESICAVGSIRSDPSARQSARSSLLRCITFVMLLKRVSLLRNLPETIGAHRAKSTSALEMRSRASGRALYHRRSGLNNRALISSARCDRCAPGSRPRSIGWKESISVL